jgi:hypothetical protein
VREPASQSTCAAACGSDPRCKFFVLESDGGGWCRGCSGEPDEKVDTKEISISTCTSCGGGWQLFQGACYRAVKRGGSFDWHEGYCAAKAPEGSEGYLASIHSDAEGKFVQSLCGAGMRQPITCRVGLRHEYNEWYW